MDTRRGFSFVEAVVAIAIAGSAIVALVVGFGRLLATALRADQDLKANYITLEAFEAARLIRDDGWDENIVPLVLGTEYHLMLSGATWTFTTEPQTIDGYERVAVFSAVDRDSDGRISESGTTDPGTLLMTVTTEWPGQDGETNTRVLSGYITDFFQ